MLRVRVVRSSIFYRQRRSLWSSTSCFWRTGASAWWQQPPSWTSVLSSLRDSRQPIPFPGIDIFLQYTVNIKNFGVPTLQIKGRWESNINVLFRFMYSQKWNCTASLFPKQNYNVLSHNFHIHESVSELYIPRISMPILLKPNRQTDHGNI